MRIAQIAPIIESIPPAKYGGTERVISALTEELVRRGHEVTLFASGDSQTKANLLSVYHTSLRKANIENMYGHNIWSLLNVGIAYQMQDQFDVIHDHNSQNNPISLPIANTAKIPVVMTLHGPLTNGYSKAFEFYKKPYLVTISKSQCNYASDLNYIGNVYNGLPMEHYPVYKDSEGYFLFVGRIEVKHGVEEKGLLNAIEIAEKVKKPLLIAAKLDSKSEGDIIYFKQYIQPRLSDKIRWIGEVNEVERNKLMSKADCLLHPVNWAEPFGLTLIEAMACGCPVIAFNKGSSSEIIVDGTSGFVVNDVQGAVRAVTKLGTIDRINCRKYSINRFSAARMTDEYEHIYQKVLSDRKIKVSRISHSL